MQAHANAGATIRASRTAHDARRHSLSIVREHADPEQDLESILETADRRGLAKIASAIRARITERDLETIELASLTVGCDELLAHAFVQFGIARGTLVCRAWVDASQEERLIELLASLPGPRRIDLEIVS